jgi:hypothetical protein
MTTLLSYVGIPSAKASCPARREAERRPLRFGSSMALKWFTPSKPVRKEQQFRLPGAGVVRVDLDKHVEKALKSQKNEFFRRSYKSSKSTGSAKG